MSTALALILDYGGSAIRMAGTPDRPEWIAADVCRVLGIVNARQAVENFDADEKGVSNTYTLGGPQQVATVTEPGLYRLILRSRKPEAKAFRRWILHEVLPALRRFGCYPPPTDGIAGAPVGATQRDIAVVVRRILTEMGVTARKRGAAPIRAAAADLALLPETVEATVRLSRARFLPIVPRGVNGKPLHLTTLLNWCYNGIRGHGGVIVKLEHQRCGGAICTSEAALTRFFNRLSAPTATSAPTERERSQQRAKEICDAEFGSSLPN